MSPAPCARVRQPPQGRPGVAQVSSAPCTSPDHGSLSTMATWVPDRRWLQESKSRDSGRSGTRMWPSAAYVSRRVSAAAWRHRVRVTVHAPAETVAERISPAVGTVEAVDDATCLLHTGADDVATLGVYLGLLGCDFTVDGPPELVAHLRELAGRYGRAVG
ncbi:WYL domain-containing protein [Planotetraspora thailandica]|uniref:WYL domain-containing protein n=1 Tax=Planotetraspora thailandica TaxID=487172 RepID=UPI00357123D8